MKYIDLHLHTRCSDGTYTPQELVAAAVRAGVSAIAVTDHDTAEGIAPALEAARLADIEVIPGIELSAEHEGAEVHILGYLIDYKGPQLLEKLDFLRKNRIQRIHLMVEKLNEIGVKVSAQTVFDISGIGTPGRLHLARALVKEGSVGSVQEAFYKYIGDKGPGFVLGFKFSPADAINLIHSVGGVAVLAHPYTLHNDDLVRDFAAQGLQGLEIYYPEHSQGMINLYLEIAQKLNLLATGGTDCHGDAKPDVRVGCLKIPYELLEKLKEAKERS